MTITIKATYQNGVIRPLGAVDLEENEQITVQITRQPVKETRPLIALAGIFKSSGPGEKIDFSKYMDKHGYEELERGEESLQF